VPLPEIDVSALPSPAGRREADRLLVEEVRRPFDLVRGPLLRAAVVALAPGRAMALLTVHHIVADGWSLAVLLEQLADLYAPRARPPPRRRPPPPPPGPPHRAGRLARRAAGGPPPGAPPPAAPPLPRRARRRPPGPRAAGGPAAAGGPELPRLPPPRRPRGRP